MKALTLIQPWATLIVAGHKSIETRSWRTPYRGPLLIHAGKKVDRYFADWLIAKGDPAARDLEELPTGAILGIANIVDICSTNSFLPPPREFQYGDYTSNRWAWQLDGIFRLDEPMACSGKLGLWEVTREIDLVPAAAVHA